MAEHGGRIVAKVLKLAGVSHLFTLSGGHLFSIYDGCRERGHRDRRRAPRAVGGIRRRGLCEGDAERSASRRSRPGLGSPTASARSPGPRPIASGLRARRPSAGDALGRGLTAGDRPPALVAHPRQVRRDGQGPRRDRRADRRGDRPGALPPRRALPSLTSPSMSSSARPRRRSRRRSRHTAPARRGNRGGRCAALRRAATGGDGRSGSLLGPRRGRAARAGRGAGYPCFPQRARARLPASRS